jgi:hypothetical protein
MRTDFLNLIIKLPQPKRSTKRITPDNIRNICVGFHVGIKMHLITHLPYMIQKYGAHKRTIDTELSENFHKITVKSNFEGTNKNESQVHKQMLINMLRSSHCKNLLGYSKTVHRHDVDNRH